MRFHRHAQIHEYLLQQPTYFEPEAPEAMGSYSMLGPRQTLTELGGERDKKDAVASSGSPPALFT
jgi:hypothetical protein